ncbi:MAG: hypothetical protein M1829_003430 [Trizodia sp. TS-e1964]|nr:MAG: hypothetical protein M1829_003430 [Trizodia sp. TS-e1964]
MNYFRSSSNFPPPPKPAEPLPNAIPPPEPLPNDPEETPHPSHNDRLSMPFSTRLPTSIGLAFLTGLGLGAPLGSITAGYRFRAEHAHRLPSTSAGWYLYHKSKNYHMLLGGLREGARLGATLGVWVGCYFVVEEAVDRLRCRKDFLSSVVAGLSVSGGFSLWNKLPFPTAARTAKMGLLVGLGFGLAQDALGMAVGRRLAYVDFIFRKRKREEEDILLPP